MRIIAGQLGGREFRAPHTTRTHPMSDKMRGALFNMLGDISGLTVLDAFAGTGALSYEAVSRGAESALVIENDKTAQRVIEENIQFLKLGQRVKLIMASAGAWLQTTADLDQFDLVLCDPPYHDLQKNLLSRLSARAKPDGLFILSWPGSEPAPEFSGLAKLEHRSYGDGTLIFYRALEISVKNG